MENEQCVFEPAFTCLLAVSALASAQSQTLVFTQDNNQPSTDKSVFATGPHVGVGSDAVVVAANRRLTLYSKVPTLLEQFDIATTSPAFPFQIDPATTSDWGDTILFDPQAGHDPIANRLWLLYLEGIGLSRDVPALGHIARLHLGVSKDPADFGGGPLNTLADTHWWYYTHDTGTMTKAGAAFNLRDDDLLRYKGEDNDHFVPDRTVRLATLAFDEQAILVTPNRSSATLTMPPASLPLFLYQADLYSQYIYIIPREHGAGAITDGDRPDESDITMLHLEADPVLPRLRDQSTYIRAVQEPYPDPASSGQTNQVENATFFISLGALDGIRGTIRLRGIFDAHPSPTVADWTLQQHLDPSFPTSLFDITMPSGSLDFAPPTATFPPMPATRYHFPRTPDTTTPVNWRPHAPGGWFQSAVLARDTEGNFRIFAAHAVHPLDEFGQPTTQWVVQWYVINPDLGNFGSSTPEDWQPSIAQPSHTQGAFSTGRIENEGDCYHPVIVVNRQGQAFIEYTYSDDSTWPQIRRVRLDSDYMAVVGSETPVRSGPMNMAYDPFSLGNAGYWADYADAQADPFDNCRYWSTHTLVHDDTPPSPTDERDVWLFRQLYAPNCFQSNSMLDLNDDTEVDAYDLAAFGPMFERGARRVDIDGNGIVEALDMVLFYDAYNAYTSR